MAVALLRRHLVERGVSAQVRSAGLVSDGAEASPEVAQALAARGVEVGGHRSRRLRVEDLAAADVVVGMAREHVREAVVSLPEVWPRTFTLKELVRRGGEAGPRSPDQELAVWLADLHQGRARGDLVGASPADDVEDPMGGTQAAFDTLADELDQLTGRVAELVFPSTREGATPTRNVHLTHRATQGEP